MDPLPRVTGSLQIDRGLGGRSNGHLLGGDNSENGNHTRVTKGELIHPGFNKFCRIVNGYVEGEEEDRSKHNHFCLRDVAKGAWIIYPLLQLVGLVNERTEKLARAWYGACWSIVYSCYRPWKPNRDKLTDENAPKKISDVWKGIYNLNEHFRVVMGSVVSAIYGSGAFGMLWGWLKGDDDFFDKAADVYKTGMLNQNQVFASMNADVVMRREFNPSQLKEVDKDRTGAKAAVEYVDTALFIPNIIARGIDTFRMFGMSVSEGTQRVINSLGYFSYGTWAARFGIMKSSEKDGSDLEKLEKTNKALYHMQKNGGIVFSRLLPALSWVAAAAELMGLREFAEKTFKLEGICERLNPAIAAWCLTNPWLQGYLKKMSLPDTLVTSRNET